MNIHYYFMLLLTLIVLGGAWYLHKRQIQFVKAGAWAWVSLSLYFVIEYFVIRATTAPYSIRNQPMSDLGITSCGTDTYILAAYEICSPAHLVMNWTFTLTGIVIIIGAVGLHALWPKKRSTKIATGLLIVNGLSYSIAGIVPADIDFWWHTTGSLPGMVVQIPALLLLSRAIRVEMPRLSHWTKFCGYLNVAILLLIFIQPFIQLPGGLLQRMLYAATWLWMVVTAVMVLKGKKWLYRKSSFE